MDDNSKYGKSILEKTLDNQRQLQYIQDYYAIRLKQYVPTRKGPDMPTVCHQCFCCKCEIISRPIEGYASLRIENIPAFVKLELNLDFPTGTQKNIYMCLTCFRSNAPEELVNVLS